MSMEKTMSELKKAFYAQDDAKVGELTKKALDMGADPVDLLEKNLIPWTNDITGKGWYSGGGYELPKGGIEKLDECVMLSDLIMVAECLQAAVAHIKPKLTASKVPATGKVVIGIAEGDVHDIGKAIVSSMWQSAGYIVEDLGIDVPAKNFVEAAKRTNADIVGVSVSMSMCRPELKKVVDGLKAAGIRENTKVMAGGQQAYPKDVENFGIDAFAVDVTEAMQKASEEMRILKEERAKKKK
jgi:dimethylamine corrinoid protein